MLPVDAVAYCGIVCSVCSNRVKKAADGEDSVCKERVCRDGGGIEGCPTRSCCQSKGLEGCW